MTQQSLLDVEHLTVRFGASTVVDDVSFKASPRARSSAWSASRARASRSRRSRCCGWSTAAQTSGAIRLRGHRPAAAVSERQMRAIRGAEIAMIFQEPMTALNPLYTVGNQIGEVLELHEGPAPEPGARACRRAAAASTGIPDPEHRVDAFPHQLSGAASGSAP